MDVIREHFTDEQWGAISKSAKLAIERADFKSLTARYVKDIKIKAFKRLDAGKKLDISKLCNTEIERLVMAGKVSSERAPGFLGKFLEQVTGAVSVKRDKASMRIYLCLGERQYQARTNAQIGAWINHLDELAGDETVATDKLFTWLSELAANFPSRSAVDDDVITKIMASRSKNDLNN